MIDGVSCFRLVVNLQQGIGLHFSISGKNKNLERSVGGVVRLYRIMARQVARESWLRHICLVIKMVLGLSPPVAWDHSSQTIKKSCTSK